MFYIGISWVHWIKFSIKQDLTSLLNQPNSSTISKILSFLDCHVKSMGFQRIRIQNSYLFRVSLANQCSRNRPKVMSKILCLMWCILTTLKVWCIMVIDVFGYHNHQSLPLSWSVLGGGGYIKAMTLWMKKYVQIFDILCNPVLRPSYSGPKKGVSHFLVIFKEPI